MPRKRSEGGRLRVLAIVAELTFTHAATHAATGAEGGQYAGPIGGSDMRVALLPPAGVYAVPFGDYGSGNHYSGPDGRTPPSTNVVGYGFGLVGGAFLLVYPWQPWGVTIASSVSLDLGFGCGKIGASGGFVSRNCAANVTDPYADLVFASRFIGLAGAKPGPPGSTPVPLPYGLTIAGGVGASIPIANNTRTDALSGGKGTWIWIPNVAATYLTGSNLSLFDATEVSGRFYYQKSSTDYRSGYRNGDVVVADFALTQRAGLAQGGLAGSVARQVTDDTVHRGVRGPNDGNRLADLQLGPVAAYDLPALGASVSAKALFEVASRNRLQITNFIIRLAWKLL